MGSDAQWMVGIGTKTQPFIWSFLDPSHQLKNPFLFFPKSVYFWVVTLNWPAPVRFWKIPKKKDSMLENRKSKSNFRTRIKQKSVNYEAIGKTRKDPLREGKAKQDASWRNQFGFSNQSQPFLESSGYY